MPPTIDDHYYFYLCRLFMRLMIRSSHLFTCCVVVSLERRENLQVTNIFASYYACQLHDAVIQIVLDSAATL